MHIISKRPFSEAARLHPNQRHAVEDVYRVLKRANFTTPEEMRRVFPSLDNFKHKDKWWVIDIAGHRLRLIAYIHFKQQRVYVKHILTHAEYDTLCWRYRKGDRK
jgi:mRNA interferase HigB